MSHAPTFKFRLYVAGDTHNSAQALANLTSLCEMYLRDRNEIEIVDVFREPGRALEDRVFMTPTLVKLAPSPVHRIVGTLNETESVSQVLGIRTVAA